MLPITLPLTANRTRQSWARNHKILFAIRNAAMILVLRHFAGIGHEIRAAQVMVIAHFRAADAREEAFRLVRASAIGRIGVLVVDALCQEKRMELVSTGGFVGVNRDAAHGRKIEHGLAAKGPGRQSA